MRLFAIDFFVLSFFDLSVRFRLFCFVAVVNDDDDMEFCVSPFSFVSQLLMLPIRIVNLSLSVGMRFPYSKIKFTINTSLLFCSIVQHTYEIWISQNQNSSLRHFTTKCKQRLQIWKHICLFLIYFPFDCNMSGTEKNRMSSSSHRRFRFVKFHLICI